MGDAKIQRFVQQSVMFVNNSRCQRQEKLVEAHLLSDNDYEYGFEKGCALIRSNLGIDPTLGSYEDWAVNYAQALWIEKWRLKNTAEMISALFGDKK